MRQKEVVIRRDFDKETFDKVIDYYRKCTYDYDFDDAITSPPGKHNVKVTRKDGVDLSEQEVDFWRKELDYDWELSKHQILR